MKTSAVLAGLTAAVAAQRPANESICDYYTTALLKDNTAANQETLLTLVVNTAVIGNYTKPNVGIAVPGILTPGTYKGTPVNLLPYFDGALDSSNRGGSSGVSVNFLDGGGAAPLEKNMPANSTTSNQYTLLTHLYEYFGDLLGCSQFANTTMPYAGFTSMYEVHKFMGLSEAEFSYFVTQVGLSAASFGVATSDVTAVGDALMDAFGYRCSPPQAIPATAAPSLQAICIDSDCPIATKSADCSAYAPVVEPTSAATTGMSSATGSMIMTKGSATMTGSATMVTGSMMNSSMMTGSMKTGSATTTGVVPPPTMTGTWTGAGTPPASNTWASSTSTPTAPYTAGVAAVAPILSGVLAAAGLAVVFA